MHGEAVFFFFFIISQKSPPEICSDRSAVIQKQSIIGTHFRVGSHPW